MSPLELLPEWLVALLAFVLAGAHVWRSIRAHNAMQIGVALSWAGFGVVYLFLWVSNLPIGAERAFLVRLSVTYIVITELINQALLIVYGRTPRDKAP